MRSLFGSGVYWMAEGGGMFQKRLGFKKIIEIRNKQTIMNPFAVYKISC